MPQNAAKPLAPAHFSPHSVAQWQDALVSWLLTEALPYWWSQGVDRVSGGFFEKIDQHGTIVDEPRRTRVTARQVFVFSAAHAMHWEGPSLKAITHGLDFMDSRLLKADGTYASAVTSSGELADPCFDLYEQAFALLALARAYEANPNWTHLPHQARQLYQRLCEGWKHPWRGFEESSPPTLPLKANPHMHLLEALLAWAQAAPSDARDGWIEAGEEIVALCLDQLTDPNSGAVKEYFDEQWRPMPDELGRIVEPGHQYEWAWLLLQWSELSNAPALRERARTLIHFAETHGVNARGVAVNELYDDGSLKDGNAKLWPQTERIKAWTALAKATGNTSERAQCLQRAAQACEGLWHYIENAQPGLWQEVMHDTGAMSDQPCRASSLYHIVCAIEFLHRHRAMMA